MFPLGNEMLQTVRPGAPGVPAPVLSKATAGNPPKRGLRNVAQNSVMGAHTLSSTSTKPLPIAPYPAEALDTGSSSLGNCAPALQPLPTSLEEDRVDPGARIAARADSAAPFPVADSNTPIDIDQPLQDDPRYHTAYVEDMFGFLLKSEVREVLRPDPEYMSAQESITPAMRKILVTWLVEAHESLKLFPATFFRTVDLIDRFLSCRNVHRKFLQLVGCGALLVAGKIEETYPVSIQDVRHISGRAFTREEIIDMETQMLRTLDFNLTGPLSLHFAPRFVRAHMAAVNGEAPCASPKKGEKDAPESAGALAAREALAATRTVGSPASRRRTGGATAAAPNSLYALQLKSMVNFLLELSEVNYTMTRFRPSEKAAAAVYLAARVVRHNGTERVKWTKTHQYYTSYRLSKLRGCVRELWKLFNERSTDSALRIKYSKPKYHSVATIDPPSDI